MKTLVKIAIAARAAELVMSLVEFGNGLDDAQRLALKRWLAYTF